MNELEMELLKHMCTGGAGQGNTNTEKLTRKIVESNPGLDYTDTKIRVVETLKDLRDKGHLQIITINWELGDEFLYICTNIID
ncbi:MAG: hypothetical protein KJ002_09155 [Candidatus Dadabacteria bacterium]|jgi:hypothetical protein|nr:hypothetical protein [Candidatus Dadabacteria bacterium]